MKDVTLILSLMTAVFIICAFEMAHGHPMPMARIKDPNNDPLVVAILNKMTAMMRKHYNITRPTEVPGTGMGPEADNYRRGNGPPPSLIRYTVQQALAMLKNMQKEFNMTDDTEFEYLLSSPLKARWRSRSPRNSRSGRISKRKYSRVGLYSLGEREDCLTSTAGHDYKGKMSTTIRGYPCQRWDAQTPHAHPFKNASFPDGSATAAANYCRNPNPQFTKGVWCYTNSETFIRWDVCDVPLCKPYITPARNVRLHRTFLIPRRPWQQYDTM